MSKWIWNSQLLLEPPEGAFGFTYQILGPTGWYIGCKSFWSTTNAKVSLKRANELYKGRGKRPSRERKIKESNWRVYNSSSTIVKQLIQDFGEEAFTFQITGIYNSKTEMQLAETQEIIDNACDPKLLLVLKLFQFVLSSKINFSDITLIDF